MTEETYERRLASNSDFKEVIRIGLDEAFTALEESLHDLDDKNAQAFPVHGQPNIAAIVAHLLQNANTFALEAQGVERIFKREDRWSFYHLAPGQMPKPGDAFPRLDELKEILQGTQRKVFEHLDQTSEKDLLRPRAPKEWNQTGNSSDMYVRVIKHYMAHLRQIWLLRGHMGLTYWPAQHWA